MVLVHGSGPNDRDETIGPNRPFRDLAWGLASRGIAVLRYEKRTKHHRTKLALVANIVTVKEETVDDALAAVTTLRENESIDAESVFVLGHSLGGMLIPRIGARDANIAGFIVFAGTTRPFEDVYLEQVSYIFSLDGEVSETESQQLEALQAQVARVKDPDLSAETPLSDLPLNIPAAYWLDLRGYDPANEAVGLRRPLFILQGGRDYQVTMDDFALWREALSELSRACLVLYDDLDHLFRAGEGPSGPDDYSRQAPVAPEVVEDVAGWIREGRCP